MPISSESREGTQAEPGLSKKPLVEDPGTGVQRRPRPPPHTDPRTREPHSTKTELRTSAEDPLGGSAKC